MDKKFLHVLTVQAFILLTISAFMIIRSWLMPARPYHFAWAYFWSIVILLCRKPLLCGLCAILDCISGRKSN